MFSKIWNRFWTFYENNYAIAVGGTAFLFILQIFHLFWLFTTVIWAKLFGYPLYTPGALLEKILVLVDYTEIPALIAASFIYIDELRQKFSLKALIFLIFLNSQWLHLFWITDEFVVSQFTQKIMLPGWLAWLAILIDYLELPVIFDTLRKSAKYIFIGQIKLAVESIKEKE